MHARSCALLRTTQLVLLLLLSLLLHPLRCQAHAPPDALWHTRPLPALLHGLLPTCARPPPSHPTPHAHAFAHSVTHMCAPPATTTAVQAACAVQPVLPLPGLLSAVASVLTKPRYMWRVLRPRTFHQTGLTPAQLLDLCRLLAAQPGGLPPQLPGLVLRCGARCG